MRVIVTGANSFIGRHLCNALDRKKYNIFAVVRECFDNNEIFKDMKNVTIVKCNMESYDDLTKIINEKCDIGIALAWNGTRGACRNDELMQKKNIEHSVMSIDAFINLNCKVIMTAGSQAEYGPQNCLYKVTENASPKPNTEYGKAKLMLFNEVKKRCEKNNIRFIEPRFFSLYGEDDYANTMIISIAKKMLRNETCDVTRCEQIWDFLYIDDAIDALVKLLENDNAYGIYNFGSGISKQLIFFVELMHSIINSKSIINYGAVPYPATGIVNVNPCIDKLIKDVGWRPQTSFEDGFNKVLDYIMKYSVV